MGRGPTEDDERWTDRPPDGTEQGRLAGRHGRPQQHAPHVRERSQRRCDLLFTPNTTSPGNILASFSLALRYRRQSAKISGCLCYCFVFYYNYFFIHSFLLLFLLILPAPASPVLPSFPLPSSTHMYVRCRQLFFFFILPSSYTFRGIISSLCFVLHPSSAFFLRTELGLHVCLKAQPGVRVLFLDV